MFFIPNLKRKRGNSNKWLAVRPFPYIETNTRLEGIFTGISVEVCTREGIKAIYDNGFYGKGSQSRSTPQIALQIPAANTEVNESLCLGLEEAFFLAYYVKVLKIIDLDANEIEYEKFLRHCINVNKHFVETLASYLYLKSKGWIVKSGFKFGGTFLIYRDGPRFYHASFVVIINIPSSTDHLDSKNFKGLQRIAETSDKDVLILEVHVPNDFQLLNTELISNIEITEMVIRRFNRSLYVQNRNTSK